MNPRVLFVISSDPCLSPRPAEAVRIAAGLGAWRKVDVTVYLRSKAVLILSEHTDELMDEENVVRHLPAVAEFGRPIYVQRGTPLLSRIGQTPLRFEEIADHELARLAAQSNYLMSF